MLREFSQLAPLAPGFLREAPSAPGVVWHERKPLSDGVKGTAETIAEMQKIVAAGMLDHEVLKVVGRILWGEYPDIPACESKNYLCYAKSIYTFCRDHIKYVYDPFLVEYVENVSRVLEKKIADCDSIVPVVCAMLQGIGLECQFVTIMASAERPDEYSHVYCRVKIPNKGWYAIDATMPKKWFGWEAPSYFKKRYWQASTHALDMPLDEEESQKVSSPSNLGFGPSDTFRMGYGPSDTFRMGYGPSDTFRMGNGDTTVDDVVYAFGELDADFKGNVQSDPITSRFEFASYTRQINDALSRYSSHWIPQMRAGMQTVDDGLKVLTSISNNIDRLKSRIAAVKGGAVPSTGIISRILESLGMRGLSGGGHHHHGGHGGGWGGGYSFASPYYTPFLGPEVIIAQTEPEQMSCPAQCANNCSAAYDPATQKDEFADCSASCATRQCGGTPAGVPSAYPLGISGLGFMGARGTGQAKGRRPRPGVPRQPRPPQIGPTFQRPPRGPRPVLRGLGYGETSIDQLVASYNALDMDYRGSVLTDPMTSRSDLAVQREEITSMLNRFASQWIPQIRQGRQTVADGVSVLDGIAEKVANFKTRLAAAKSGEAVPPAIGPVRPVATPDVRLAPAPAPSPSSATSWVPWVIGGVAVLGLGYYLMKGRS